MISLSHQEIDWYSLFSSDDVCMPALQTGEECCLGRSASADDVLSIDLLFAFGAVKSIKEFGIDLIVFGNFTLKSFSFGSEARDKIWF